MSIRNLHIKQLYALRELIETKSISQAAENLVLSQSAMSSVLNKIRHILNDKIIVRAGNEMLLTPYALKIKPMLNRLISNIDTLFCKMSQFDPEQYPSHFTIAVSTMFEHLYLPTLLKKISQYPLMTVEFITNIQLNSKNIDQYKERDIDFFLFQNIELPNCENIPILSSDICLITHTFNQEKYTQLSLEDYYNLPHVNVKKASEMFDFSSHFSIEDRRNIVITTDTLYTCLNIINNNKEMVATLPYNWVKFYLDSREFSLTTIPLPFTGKQEKNYIAWPKDKSLSTKHIWMKKLLLTLLNKMKDTQL